LQVDNDGIDNAGRRINELSKPLAQAGISIFYLSTYQTDLVFVKEKRLQMVVQALDGWHVTDLSALDRLEEEGEELSATRGDISPRGHGSMSGQPQKSAKSSLSPPIPIPISIGHHSPSAGPQTTTMSQSSASSLDAGYFHLTSSFSPTSDMAPTRAEQMTQGEWERMMNEVRRLTKREVLGRTLRLCGLNRDYTDAWALALIRVLLFPEFTGQETHDRFFSYTTFDEGLSLVADESIVAATFEDHHINISPRPLSCIQVDLDQFGLDRFGIVFSMSDPLTRHSINLLYLSTYRTANVLVSVKDLPRAMAILDEMSVAAEQEGHERSGSEPISASERTNGRGSFSSSTNLAGSLGVSAHSEGMSVPSRYRVYDDDDDTEEHWRGQLNTDLEELDFDDSVPPFSISLQDPTPISEHFGA
jgi:hypothetical protein